jgi:hypothetical protein
MRKGQSSVEFLLIVAFSLLMLIPATLLFLNYNNDSQDAVVNAQVFRAGNELALTSDLIYNVGVGSWQTLELIIPEAVTAVTVYEGLGANAISELVFTYGAFDSTVVFYIDLPLVNATQTVTTCIDGCDIPLHEGLNRIRVESVQASLYPVIRFTVVE